MLVLCALFPGVGAALLASSFVRHTLNVLKLVIACTLRALFCGVGAALLASIFVRRTLVGWQACDTLRVVADVLLWIHGL